MLYNIPCRIYILSTLSLCISGIVSTATATSSETKISNEETLVVTTNRSASNLWESPATIQVIDQQTLQNSTNASIADNLQDIPGVEITDNSLAGRKQIRIRGEASSRVLIRKRLVRTVLIFTESSDQLSRATDRVPGLPASPGYVQ